MVTFISFMLGSSAGSSATGLYLFRSLTISSLAAVCLLATFASATVFIRERNERTLGLLFLTDITTEELLLGKLWATLSFTVLAAFSILPMFVIMVALGGVTAIQIITAYALLLCTTFLCNCMGLLVSSLVKTDRGMVFMLCVVLCLILLILPGVLFLLCSFMGVADGPVVGVVSPFRAMVFAMDIRTLKYSAANCFFDVGLGVVVLLTAHGILCRKKVGSDWLSVHQEEMRPEAIRSRTTGEKGRIAASSNPITWRDLNFSYGNRHTGRLALSLLSFLAVVCVPAAYWMFVRSGTTSLYTAIGSAIAGLTAVSAIIFLVGSLFYCSQAFSKEKRSRVLDLLYITDMSVEEIFIGKLFAVFRALLPWLICTVAGLFALLLFGGAYSGFLSVLFVGDYLSMCLAYPFLALSLALRFKRFVALGICITVFILWNTVGRLLIILMLFKANPVVAGLFVDFAFHAELVLIGSIYMERSFGRMEQAGTIWAPGDEFRSK
jgi:ABC-type transport system involved in multi-copper enzyme maturation permease subunit